jgi:hypothetical protein
MLDQQTRDAVLRAADFFAANSGGHTKYCLARALSGEEVSPTSPFARSWCALGRIAKELDIGYDDGVRPIDARHKIYERLCDLDLDTSSIFIASDEARTELEVAGMLKDLIDA